MSIVARALFSTATTRHNLTREARFMKKIMTTGNKKLRKHWYLPEEYDRHQRKMDVTSVGKSGGNLRRVSVLNSVFFKYITGFVATGEVGALGKIAGKGIEITKVQMAPDIHQVNVYWYTSRNDTPESELETLLKEVGHTLRHELSQLRVIGLVPPIKFIHDKTQGKTSQVEYLLSVADMGDLDDTTNESPENPDIDNGKWPELRLDILGLNRAAILERVVRGVNKGRAVHRDCPLAPLENIEIGESEGVVNTEAGRSDSEVGNRAADFATYLRKARATRLKSERLMSRVLADENISWEEAEDRKMQRLGEMSEVWSDSEGEDFIDEEYET